MQPVLETERLTLRPFELRDAHHVQQLARHIDIAKTTLSIPHPYPDGAAEDWIESRQEAARLGSGYAFAIIHKDNDSLMGCMGINIAIHHWRGELAYFVGKPYWGQGFATEAARRVMAFGFGSLELHKMWAASMASNPASAKVIEKLGMKQEGMFREHVLKWDRFEDLVYYGMLKSEYEALER